MRLVLENTGVAPKGLPMTAWIKNKDGDLGPSFAMVLGCESLHMSAFVNTPISG